MTLQDFKSRDYKSLTKWEWEFLRVNGVCNGCGGTGTQVKNRLIRWIILQSLKRLRLVFWQADCNIHDFTYWQGGDEARRKECDMGFFKRIIEDIENAVGISVIKYTLLALIFYYAVRIGGKDYFNYH